LRIDGLTKFRGFVFRDAVVRGVFFLPAPLRFDLVEAAGRFVAGALFFVLAGRAEAFRFVGELLEPPRPLFRLVGVAPNSIVAWAAASLAIGTRSGLHET